MKRMLALAFAVTLSLGLAATASAEPSTTYNVGDSANGIGWSRHNLGSFGEHDTTTETTEICVFCHTPHHTNASASDYAPLWNRTLNSAGFTAYGTTIAGTNNNTVGGGSLACLSCHDGVTTLDNLVNAPGRDGVGSPRPMGWQFYDDGIPSAVSPVITITGTRHNIGRDLTNDHPMSVDYNSQNASLRPRTTVISSIDLTWDLAHTSTTFDASNITRNLWAVKGRISDSATIEDLLRGGKVECASCHDPHFSNKTGASPDQGFDLGVDSVTGLPDPEGWFWGADNSSASWDGLFLRRVGGNVASAVCRTCHNK